jgi:hypothetical protein
MSQGVVTVKSVKLSFVTLAYSCVVLSFGHVSNLYLEALDTNSLEQTFFVKRQILILLVLSYVRGEDRIINLLITQPRRSPP